MDFLLYVLLIENIFFSKRVPPNADLCTEIGENLLIKCQNDRTDVGDVVYNMD